MQAIACELTLERLPGVKSAGVLDFVWERRRAQVLRRVGGHGRTGRHRDARRERCTVAVGRDRGQQGGED